MCSNGFKFTLIYRNSLKPNAEFMQAGINRHLFVMTEGELLKVSMLSAYTTKAISHKRDAIQDLCTEADGYTDTV